MKNQVQCPYCGAREVSVPAKAPRVAAVCLACWGIFRIADEERFARIDWRRALTVAAVVLVIGSGLAEGTLSSSHARAKAAYAADAAHGLHDERVRTTYDATTNRAFGYARWTRGYMHHPETCVQLDTGATPATDLDRAGSRAQAVYANTHGNDYDLYYNDDNDGPVTIVYSSSITECRRAVLGWIGQHATGNASEASG